MQNQTLPKQKTPNQTRFNQKYRKLLLLAISIAIVACLFFVGPIPQDPHYHYFVDTQTLLGVKNMWNVLSNLPFLAVGIFAFWRAPRLLNPETKTAYWVLSVGIMLVGVGSAYYHDDPSNATLLWDRMPMTIAFMALFSMMLEDRVIGRRHALLLWLLVSIGIASTLYWAWTEANGVGDLRPYAVVQFLPIILIPLIMALFPQQKLSNCMLLHAFFWYLAAKVLEHYDHKIFELSGLIGGHPLKHLAAAIASLYIVRAAPVRAKPVQNR